MAQVKHICGKRAESQGFSQRPGRPPPVAGAETSVAIVWKHQHNWDKAYGAPPIPPAPPIVPRCSDATWSRKNGSSRSKSGLSQWSIKHQQFNTGIWITKRLVYWIEFRLVWISLPQLFHRFHRFHPPPPVTLLQRLQHSIHHQVQCHQLGVPMPPVAKECAEQDGAKGRMSVAWWFLFFGDQKRFRKKNVFGHHWGTDLNCLWFKWMWKLETGLAKDNHKAW